MKKPSGYNRKMSDETYDRIFKEHAQGLSPIQITRNLDKENIPHPNYNRIVDILKAPKYQSRIQFFRKKYLSSVTDVPIANKRIRLDILQNIVTNINKTLPRIVDGKGSIRAKSMRKFLQLTKRLNDFLITARDEMEKKPQLQLVQIQGSHLTNEELLNEERSVEERLVELRARGIRFSNTPKDRVKESEESPDTPEPA